MPDSIQPILAWFSMHPTWAGLGVFGITCAESLAIVGLFMPGMLLMFGIGALVAVDALSLWPTLAWATAGAITGDVVSFWLGRHFHLRLKVMWPFRHYPRLMNRGVDFFHRHGGKSVAIGRFIGPVRPILPLVAGMLGMHPVRFLLVAVPAAMVWAPVFILPGVAFGASLQLAAEVATRLAVLLALVILVPWAVYWLVRRAYGLLAPRGGRLLDRALDWGHSHPVLGRITAGLVDPQEPESRALLLSALLLLLGTWGFFRILVVVTHHQIPLPLDHTVYHFSQGLRSPWGDRLMVLVTELGGQPVDISLTLAVAAWLALRRRWLAAGHWVAAVTFGVLATLGLKVILEIPRPVPDLYGGLSTYAFPSAHATLSTVTYGFLAVLIARELRPSKRWLPYTVAALIISLVVLSRIYLGAHWLTDVLAGTSLGLAWVALLGIAYRRHSTAPLEVGGVLAAALVGLLAAGVWQVGHQYRLDLQRYTQRHPIHVLTENTWWQGGWRQLPAFRIDLAGRQTEPLTVQWAGPLTTLEHTLRDHGWVTPPPLTPSTALRWLSSRPVLDKLPALPQVHNGRHGSLLMIHPEPADPVKGGQHQWVLRLWTADTRLMPGGIPVWVGTITEQSLYRPLGLVAVPRAGTRFNRAVRTLEGFLDDLAWRAVRRHGPTTTDPNAHWNGTVLLIRALPPTAGRSSEK
ncbi:MAG TPA: VTT domain-containing protein [Gammaproteobacteria bacterium]|nr:VTT domain-containing protein [Gammaproteobacteria bacterium]